MMDNIADGRESPEAAESKMRLLVDKRQLLADSIKLMGLLDEYCRFLSTIGSDSEWTRRAQFLLRKHGQFLDQTRLSLQSLELAAALIRHILALRQGEFIAVPTTDAVRDRQAMHVSDANRDTWANKDEIGRTIARINALSTRAPLAIQQKLRLLLKGLLKYLELLPNPDSKERDQVLAEINLLTSNRESRHLVREVARLARDVYNSINVMSEGFPVEMLVESTQGVSEAVRKLRSVIQRLEQAATQNLDQIEQMRSVQAEDAKSVNAIEQGLKRALGSLSKIKARHPVEAATLNAVLDRLGNESAGPVMHLSLGFQKQGETMLQLVSSQSFQDLTGATLKRTITFIENLQLQLVELLERYRSVLSLAQSDSPLHPVETAAQPSPRPEASQDQVDQILSQFGF
jgi:chemotaxis regulatin CheY-phosphate phosphatase CheZ